MSLLLDGKVAIVTGAGHGIGRGHALELAKHGAKVVVNDLGTAVDGAGSGRDAESVVALIESEGGIAAANFGDVGDESDANNLVEQAVKEFGRLDVLVNNAGITRDLPIWDMTAEDFDLVMRVHVRGTWLTSRAAARYWREQSAIVGGKVYGRIINTTSGSGLFGNAKQTNYSAAKAAIAGLTLALSVELADLGVTVNAISPGGLTRLYAAMSGLEAPGEPDEWRQAGFDPKDPWASCPVVAWLASDEAGFVSGQVIRAIGEKLQLMTGWSDGPSVLSGGQRWDATALGDLLGIDIFGTRAPGVRRNASLKAATSS